MAVKFANNVSTTLSSAINASQTTISVADASGLPALSSGDYVYLTLDSNDSSPTLEVVKVTAISSNDLTVVRGRDGTTASSFSSGAKVELRITAAGLDDISSQAQSAAELAADNESVSKDGDTMTGDLTLGDNNKLILGGSTNNLEIYNDGSNSIIKETAAGSLMIRGSSINLQNTSNANLLSAVSGGAVKLYNNGALRFQTTATGADVPGAITAYGATISNANPSTTMLTLGSSSQTGYTLQDWRTSSHGATEAYIIAYGASHSTEAGNFAIKNLEANSDIFFELASNVKPLRLTSSGATFAGSIDVTSSASYGVTANRGFKSTADIPNFTLVESDASNQTWQINSTSALFTVRDVSRQADRFTIDTAGNADFAGHISLPDSKYLRLGADNDFIIYHDGTTNYIQTVKQDSDLIIRGNDGGTNFNALTIDMSAGGNATFAGTLSSGAITSTGNMSLSNTGTGNNITISRTDSSTSAVFHIGSSRGYVGTTSDHEFEIRQNDTPAITIDTSGNTTVENNLVVDGNLTVSGTTTTIDTANLNVEDNNITLNYSTGDSSATANGAGITIQDAVNGSTDAAMTWNASSDFFNFSHKINAQGDVQAYNFYGQDVHVLNAAGTGWHEWATRANDKVTLDVSNISSGVHTITSSGTIGGATIANGYLKITDGTDTLGIDPNEIMCNDTLYLNSANGEVRFRGDNSAGAKLFNGNTQFMSASRNLLNIGTISSGAITSSGTVTWSGGSSTNANTAYSWGNHASAGYLTSLSFNNLTGKTSGTGDYSTNGDLVAGRGSGSIALTINDGKGNSNVTFNHQNGVPDQNGNAARIEVNTDSSSGATMYFEVKSNVTSGTSVDLTPIMRVNETGLYMEANRVIYGSSGVQIQADDVDFVLQDSTDSTTNIIWRDHSASKLYLGTSTAQVELRSGLNLQSGHAIQINGTTVIDSSRNLTNIVGLYGSSGTVNHYNTNHYFKSTTSNLQAHISDTGIGVGTSPSAVGAGNTTAGLGLFSDGRIYASKSGNTVMSLNRNSSNGVIAEFRYAGNTIGNLGVEGGDSLFIQSDGSTGGGLRFHNSGRISPVRNGALVDNVIDLGNTTQQFANLYLGTGLYMSGSKVINSSRALTNITGLTLSSSTHANMKATFTDTTADASFYGFHIDYNASGSDTTTADRIHAGLFIDADSSASGGGTSHEHRFYGAYITATASGDSDLIDGAFMQARADNFGTGNQVTYLRGNNAMGLAHHDAGTISSTMGVYGYGQDSSSGSGQSSNVYGGYFVAYGASSSSYTGTNFIGARAFAQIGASQSSDIASAVAVWGEVQLDNDTATDHDVTIGSAFVFRAEYDENDADDTYTVNNGYLYYGNYAGALPTTAWGVYIADNVPNYFAGTIRTSDGSTTTASYGFIGDVNTGMYSPANHEVGFLANGTQRLKVNADGITVTGGVRVNSNSNDTSSSMAGQTPKLYVNGYTSLGGLRIQGTDSSNTIYKQDGDLSIKIGTAHAINLGVSGGVHLSITSSGHTNIADGKVLQMNGTTVIDSNSFRGREYIRHQNSNNIVMDMDHDTYTMFKNPLGETRVWLGSTGYNGASSDNGNYYNAANHYFRDASSNQVLTVNSTATDVKANLRVNGTTVITSARVLQSVTANANIITSGTLASARLPSTAVQFGSYSELHSSGDLDDLVGFRLYRVTGGTNRATTSHHNVLQISNSDANKYNAQLAFTTASTNNEFYFRAAANGTYSSWERMFADNYHPNADKWTTARTLTLTGDVTGSVSIDGSGNVSLATTKISTIPKKNTAENISAHWEWQDNQQVRLGNGADFRMYFDAADTIFRNYAHTNGDILFQGEDSNGTNRALVYMKTDSSAAYVQLFCVGNEKLRTVSTGVNIYGDLTATGNVTAYSDIRKKTNIQPLEGGLDIVKALEPKRFDWIESGKGSLGFIAQEVEEYLPELVDTEVNEIVELDDNQKPVTTGEEEVKSLDYGKMVSVLWAAVKEQSAQIETLNKRIEELENGNH